MKLAEMKLVTIIANKDLKDELINFLKESGVTGYTTYDAYGKGISQLKDQSIEEVENIKIKVLTSPFLAGAIMKAIAQTYFDQHKMVIYEQEARVVRPEKFDKK